MDLRLALYDIAEQHKLDARAAERLQQFAGLEREPPGLAYWLPRGIAVFAAALGGMGIIFWVAANWETFGRFGRFAVLQGFFVVISVGALSRPAARAPLSLLALLAIGGLLAYFGQTYQTGADPWQLFAIWTIFSLPLCCSARSDVLWTPWSLVFMTGIALWVRAHTGNSWRVEAIDLPVHTLGWGAALALTFFLSPQLRRVTGAGPWSLHAGLTLSTIMITTTALGALFWREIAPQYWIALLMLIGAFGALSSPRFYDMFGLSSVGLALNVLAIAGLAYTFFSGNSHEMIGRLLVLGLVAAGLLAATVSVLLQLSRRQTHAGGRA